MRSIQHLIRTAKIPSQNKTQIRKMNPSPLLRGGFLLFFIQDIPSDQWLFHPESVQRTHCFPRSYSILSVLRHIPFNACEFQSKGDPITDLCENLSAEQKARSTYDNILRLVKDPEVCDPIRFLREREIVHFQRFGEALRDVQDHLNCRNFYAFNPAFDQNRENSLAK